VAIFVTIDEQKSRVLRDCWDYAIAYSEGGFIVPPSLRPLKEDNYV